MGGHLLRREALRLLWLALAALPALVALPAWANPAAALAPQPASRGSAAAAAAAPADAAAAAAPRQALPPRHLRGAEGEFVLPVPQRLQRPEVQASLQALLRGLAAGSGPEAALDRALLYRHFIAQRLGERGLPPELLFLPVLESAYRVSAVSRSGAVGLWQLMSNTAVPLGLRQDRWVE